MLNFGADKNVFDLAQEFSSLGAEFVIRYCSVVQVKQDMIIECEGATYDIVAPPAEIGLRQFWKITCKAKV
jgi:SPP1 family predicted phage head-tail adaptor